MLLTKTAGQSDAQPYGCTCEPPIGCSVDQDGQGCICPACGRSCAFCAEGSSLWADALARTAAMAEEPPLFLEHPLPLGWAAYDGQMAMLPDKSPDSLQRAFDLLGVDLRHNARAHLTEWAHASFGWTAANDRLTAKIRDVLGERFAIGNSENMNERKGAAGGKVVHLHYSAAGWAEAVNVILYDRGDIDPFREYLESLPAWDGKPRVDSLLTRLFVIGERTELADWASRFILLGAVTRTYEPGCKMDEGPVLIGDGGIGKSTFLRGLLPPEHGEWFSDGLNFAADAKVKAEALQGRVIVEAAEMTGATRADQEAMKAFLSRTDDGNTRRAYRRDPEPSPRRCVIVGTADREQPLPNDPNLRRFVPVYLDNAGHAGIAADVRETLDSEREQLWAEALVMHRNGAEARLPDALKAMQAEATAAARSSDAIIEDAIVKWTATAPHEFTLAELAEGIGMADRDKATRLRMADAHRLGAALVMLGFAKRQSQQDGRRVMRWYRL